MKYILLTLCVFITTTQTSEPLPPLPPEMFNTPGSIHTLIRQHGLKPRPDTSSPCCRTTLSLMHLAASFDKPDAIKTIHKACTDEQSPNNVDVNGTIGNLFEWRPIHEAAKEGSLRALQTLLDLGADPNPTVCLKHRYRPIHVAAICGQLGATRILLGQDINTDVLDAFGATPLMNAARHIEYLPKNPHYDHYSVAKLLLECGANVLIEDTKGHNALSTLIGNVPLSQTDGDIRFDILRQKCIYLLIRYGSKINTKAVQFLTRRDDQTINLLSFIIACKQQCRNQRIPSPFPDKEDELDFEKYILPEHRKEITVAVVDFAWNAVKKIDKKHNPQELDLQLLIRNSFIPIQ